MASITCANHGGRCTPTVRELLICVVLTEKRSEEEKGKKQVEEEYERTCDVGTPLGIDIGKVVNRVP